MLFNLKMRYKIFFLTIFSSCLSVGAQISEPGYSFAVMPTIGNRLISYKDNVSAKVKDSLKKADGWRDAIGASLMYSFKSNKTTRIHVGFQFHNFGFTRKKENIRFMDTIHPDIGMMTDLSQTGPSYVDFNYRYMYLSIPFLISKQISGKKMKSSTLHFIFGGSLSGLLRHDINAQFHGFSLKGGDKQRKLDDKESEAGLLNGNLHLGMRLENKVFKSTFVFVQPTLFAPILNANYGKQRHHLYALGLEVGIMYRPEAQSKKEE